MNTAKELLKFQSECEAHFEKLYSPEGKVLVFGEGNPHAKLMLIGEAPGEQEALQKRPFVGKAGKNLDEFLALAGLQRESIYITNVVKIRPSRVSPKGRICNRAPNPEELLLFTPWLKQEIALIAPKTIVTLGNVPLHAVTGQKTPIGQCHGQFWEGEILGARLFPLYHPASVIYNRSLANAYQEDILFLRDHL